MHDLKSDNGHIVQGSDLAPEALHIRRAESQGAEGVAAATLHHLA